MKIKLFGILFCTMLLFTGCYANKGSVEKNYDNKEVTAFIGTAIFDESLDPVKGAMCYGYGFTNNALLKVNEKSEYVGDLAERWEISPDALTYTFKLKKDIKFSDGSDFTAEDVVFTYNMVKENQAQNENVDLTRLENVTAKDDHTVEFKLRECYSPFFDTTAMLQIVPSDGYNSEDFDKMPIGTGAWKVAQYDANQQIILEPNEKYFGKAPDIKKITLVYMDNDVAFTAAKSGQLDIVMVGLESVNEKIDGMNLQKFKTMDVRNVSMPVTEEHIAKNSNGESVAVGNDITCDKAVREALAIGIDREKIINNAFNGIGVPAVNFTDNLIWANTENYSDNRRDEAAEILRSAGWNDVSNDGIREKDGKRCSFDVYAPTGDNDRYYLAAALSEDAKELGIEINVKTATWDEIASLQNTDGVVWGWGQFSPTVLYSMFRSDLFLSGGYDNASGYNDPDVDDLIEKALSANNQKDAVDLWKDVQKEAEKDYPYLYLVNIEHCYFVNENIDLSPETQIPHPHGHGSPIICNMNEWKYK